MMMPTVAEVLELPVLRQGRPRVAAGHRGLSRAVRWAHAAEIADIARLLRQDDLVLTTGIALPEDGVGLAGYVDGLVRAGAAGLVVELGRRWHDGPPEAMLTQCERAGLALITLGRETRFAAVTEAVGELVVDSQLAELRFSEEVHRTFDRLSLAGAIPPEILSEVSRMSGLPVVLESARHQVLGYDAGRADPQALLERWEARSRAVAPEGRTGYDDPAGWLVTDVGARGDHWGRLVLVTGDQPARRLVVLLESAASALALERLAARDRDSLERQTHRTLLAELTSADPLGADVPGRSEALGVPLRERQLLGMMIGRANGAGDPAAAPPLALQEWLRDLAEVTATAARDLEMAALVGVVDDEGVLVLLSLARTASADRQADRLARAVHRAGARSPRTGAVVVAAGSPVAGPGRAARTLDEARHVLEAARRDRHQHRDCHRLVDVRLRGLLHLLADDGRLRGFVDREIGPLLRHDAAHGTDLLPTVLAYLGHGRNKAAAAAALHISRPALYDRLERAERVLGVNLADPESTTSLHVAALAQEITGASAAAPAGVGHGRGYRRSASSPAPTH